MIPIKYNIGNLTSRRMSTLMSVIGIGVVIAVMLSMMALYSGVRKATISSGSKDILMVMREGAEAEISSWVTKDKFDVIRTLPGIEKDRSGQPTVSPETVIIFKLPKKDDPKGSNVIVRGVTPAAFDIRPQVKLVAGRMFHTGTNEMIASRRISNRFVNTGIGDSFQFGSQKYTVVGLFDGAGTAFDSEMWMDVGYLAASRKRVGSYSLVMIKPVDHAAYESIKAAITTDNRLKLSVRSEYQYYADQTKGLNGIAFLVAIVTLFMMAGAVLGTMNTMFGAIASRGREIGTLRALGFSRRSVLFSMMIESAFVALIGGVAGILLSLPVNLISTGTTNFQTFSEVAFNFDVNGTIATIGIVIALISGVIGGTIPAMMAAMLPITRALREI
jgi:ABC-type lipoprotein release transport system permease subunit